MKIPSTIALVLVLHSVSAADWPNWRGPNHDGISAETGWKAEWPADGPPQLWKTSVGTGFASFAVRGGRVFTMGNASDADSVYCLDADTGKVIWKYSYPCALNPMMYEGGPSATPAVEGNHVYTLSKLGDLFCLTADAGQVVWQKHLAADAKAEAPNWGFAGSPLVAGDLLILDVGGQGMAVKKDSGEIAWNSGGSGSGYSSPVPSSVNGVAAAIIVLADEVAALDVKTGKKLWGQSWKTEYDINAADAVVAGPQVFVSSGYGHGAAVLHLSDGAVVWQNKKMRNHINSSVALDGYVYGMDGNAGSTTLTCLELATGNVKWTRPGLGGSLMIADKKIIALSEKGELVIGEASPTAFQPLTQAQILGGKCWTTPILANGRIFARNARGDVVCLDVRKK
ncbi:MAG TPA: PQQ-binding-like beta-propeller repeat protein [Verrucomicrobiae bacterium]|jgi:outer membrane protein assembly factor BamB|nr:PQQ-binding-like beta-propeller repeat protein [Verrucomicrobiae bacterium]